MKEELIHPTLTSFLDLPFVPFLQLLECLNGYMRGDNLTMKFPPDFHKHTGFNGLVKSFSKFSISPLNTFILGCKPH